MSKRKASDGEASPSKVLKCSENIVEQVRHRVEWIYGKIKVNFIILQAAPRQKNPTSADEHQKLDAIVFKLLKNIEMNINNKFTKQNVWESDAINLYHKFTQMEKHMSYSFAGQAIETVTKIFSIRVDSLYDDVIRINAVFGLNGKNRLQPRETSNKFYSLSFKRNSRRGEQDKKNPKLKALELHQNAIESAVEQTPKSSQTLKHSMLSS